MIRFTAIVAAGLLACCMASTSMAQTVVNGGFNDLSGWSTTNDATLAHPGGVAPWSWNTPVVGTLVVNATETVLPTEGSGMGITYAGSDSFLQSVTFPADGDYTFQVDVNSITGTAVSQMVDGQFRFVVGGANSPTFTVPNADVWQTYSWTTSVLAGSHNVGVRNTLSAQYAIAYDRFSIVPEPATLAICLIGMVGFVGRRR